MSTPQPPRNQSQNANAKPRVVLDPPSYPRRPLPKAVGDIRQTKEYKAASRR
ncbi:uncharacterized protein BDV17DRAFT_262877 [Aspergillus undulatus]|uniref:uncharacterized protein n=1 Tax=Aspergillus undulatus TaxID=1810928 RepID=UPI003CCDB8CC